MCDFQVFHVISYVEYTNGAQVSKYLFYGRTMMESLLEKGIILCFELYAISINCYWIEFVNQSLNYHSYSSFSIKFDMQWFVWPRFLYICWTLLTTSGIQQHYSIDLMYLLAIEWHLSPSFHWVCVACRKMYVWCFMSYVYSTQYAREISIR